MKIKHLWISAITITSFFTLTGSFNASAAKWHKGTPHFMKGRWISKMHKTQNNTGKTKFDRETSYYRDAFVINDIKTDPINYNPFWYDQNKKYSSTGAINGAAANGRYKKVGKNKYIYSEYLYAVNKRSKIHIKKISKNTSL